MAIKNSVSNNFLSMFVDSINVFNCTLSSVFMLFSYRGPVSNQWSVVTWSEYSSTLTELISSEGSCKTVQSHQGLHSMPLHQMPKSQAGLFVLVY